MFPRPCSLTCLLRALRSQPSGDRARTNPLPPASTRTPFEFFSIDASKTLHSFNSSLTAAQMNSALVQRWLLMSEAEQATYVLLANQDKVGSPGPGAMGFRLIAMISATTGSCCGFYLDQRSNDT